MIEKTCHNFDGMSDLKQNVYYIHFVRYISYSDNIFSVIKIKSNPTLVRDGLRERRYITRTSSILGISGENPSQIRATRSHDCNGSARVTRQITYCKPVFSTISGFTGNSVITHLIILGVASSVVSNAIHCQM